jgi:hypothetical protein
MSATIYKGQILTKNDLKVFILDENGNYMNPFSIIYTIYRCKTFSQSNVPVNNYWDNIWRTQYMRYLNGPPDITFPPADFPLSPGNTIPVTYQAINPNNTTSNQECGEEPVLETIDSQPIIFGIGKFFAAWKIANDLDIGTYRIKWHIRKLTDSPIYEEIEKFNVINRIDQYNYSLMNGANGRLPNDEYGNENLWAG